MYTLFRKRKKKRKKKKEIIRNAVSRTYLKLFHIPIVAIDFLGNIAACDKAADRKLAHHTLPNIPQRNGNLGEEGVVSPHAEGERVLVAQKVNHLRDTFQKGEGKTGDSHFSFIRIGGN